MTHDGVVLELLCEPLPAAEAAAAAAQLGKLAAGEFSGAGLPFASAESFATCRRLVLHVSGVPASPAAKNLLPRLLPRVLSRVVFSRSRAWEPSGFQVPRPARGLLALHGARPVAFSLAGLRAGRVTEGHESLGPRQVKVPSAEKYFRALENAYVLVRDDARLAAMSAALAAASNRMKLGIEAHEETLRACLYALEYPVPVVSGFSQEFMALPPERLRAAMRALAFFPVSDDNGRPQPYFAGFRDGSSRGQRNAEDGFRAALEACLRRA